ncbi:hypothetical protein ACFFMN_34710 [Planobispora siamensis]|uniref:Uncharacterized protein n=1 Tax=Planobispora siamensis TaxID=936338 RepID=A0A8J3WQB9_9ACTN|nr:hypothetical protein [Planobispora siamensis]GIH97895.1 hypothetical protein Psi01_85250 [Planobispora siamensis]
MTPEPVRRKAPLTVKGVLYGRVSTARPAAVLAGQRITIQFRSRGSSVYWTVTTVTTTRTGSFSKQIAAAADGYWRVVYPGSSAYAAVTGPADYVDVR